MDKTNLRNLFGSYAAIAAALGITRAAVCNWPDVVPVLRQYQLRERFPDLDQRLSELAAQQERAA